jgi:hypothetical protein
MDRRNGRLTNQGFFPVKHPSKYTAVLGLALLVDTFFAQHSPAFAFLQCK